MKTKTSFLILFTLCFAFTGCAGLSNNLLKFNQTAPAVTNTVATLQIVTNTIAGPVQIVTNTIAGLPVIVTNQAAPVIVVVTNSITREVVTPAQGTYEPAAIPAAAAATLAAIPLPGAGIASIFLGWALTAFAAYRNKKLSVALTTGIEAGRQILQTTPQGQALDAKFKDVLIQHQEIAGVLNQASALVNAYTGDTVKPQAAPAA
ncbi:MAG: hypothetical protein WCS42_08430 [Verrucomicrobiota bacterium]